MKWISVKERLPEEGDSVLFYDSGLGDIEVGQFIRVGWHPEWADTIINAKRVTHWMVLPEPPEET